MSAPASSRTAEIRAVARHDPARAEVLLAALLRDLFSIAPRDLLINHDQYSLNSLNGFFTCELGECFFKFHQEEGEEAMRGEYYRADILARAGLPVDQPLLVSALPGEQILVYRRRRDRRFSDVLRALDLQPDGAAASRAVAAEAALNDHLLQVARRTLHPITPAQSAAEPIHRLFHQRLIDLPAGTYPGGRLAAYYLGRTFALPDPQGPWQLEWEQLAHAQIVVNGIAYRDTLAQLFDAAHARLAPERLADAGGVAAHGDAHNANVWYESGPTGDRLALFDPAFAGEHVPALLAEVKSTFHNALAHPLWLYDSPLVAGHWHVSTTLDGGRLVIETDWAPTPLRRHLLEVKARHFWRPFLATLQARDLLPADWERVVRLALFLCPTLVMNLRAKGPDAGAGVGQHTPESSAIGLAVAVACGSEPVAGGDRMTEFFDLIRPEGAALA